MHLVSIQNVPDEPRPLSQSSPLLWGIKKNGQEASHSYVTTAWEFSPNQYK